MKNLQICIFRNAPHGLTELLYYILSIVLVFFLRATSDSQNSTQLFLRLADFDQGGEEEQEVQQQHHQKRSVKIQPRTCETHAHIKSYGDTQQKC